MKFQPKRLTGYSESDLIQEIRRVVQECGGVIPSRKEFACIARIHPTTITIKFGSYPQAIRKAGFDYTEKYTAEQVKANLSEVLKRANGYCFSQDFFSEKWRYLQRKNCEINSWCEKLGGRTGISWSKKTDSRMSNTSHHSSAAS